MKRFPYPQIVLVAITIILIVVLMLVRPRKPSPTSSNTPVSAGVLESALWQDYKQHYLRQGSGQAFDPQNGGVTTSEAQSYTMLRAVWANDRTTFNRAWQWTSQHLQRSDKLFSWQWGKKPDGSTGILTGSGGQNTASDADTDIALSLVMADARWHDTAYLDAAKAIVPSIWEQEVVVINGKPYLVADDVERNSPTPLLNPSYFAPYAYRVFASIDPLHPWNQLADQSYATLRMASQQQLGADKSAGLPPDWVQIDRGTGQLAAAQGHDADFGFDALRAVWRTALDLSWNNTADAKSTLASFSTLTDKWDHDHKLFAIYNHAGTATVNYASIAMYGGTLGYFAALHPTTAQEIYQQQLASLYDTANHRLKSTLNYYDNNWAWFGVALYAHNLPKLVPNGVTR